MRAWIASVVVIALWTGVARGGAPTLPDRTDRLVELARLWGRAKFIHPYLWTRDIDWDAALVSAIPKVESATTIDQYRVALQGMLATLGDPVTRVIDGATAIPPVLMPDDWIRWPEPTTLEAHLAGIAMSDVFDFPGMRQATAKLVTAAAKAKVAIFDLRGTRGDYAYAFDDLVPMLPAFDTWPTVRTLEHRGYRSQDGATSGDYYSTFVTVGAKPPHLAPASGPAHILFVVDGDTAIPPIAMALQAAGKATLVAQGRLRSDTSVLTEDVELASGLIVEIRASEAMSSAPVADIVVPAGKDPLALARELATHLPKATRRKVPPALLPLRVRDDNDYADAPYPTRELRLLAGIRMWAVVDAFEPYRYLAGDWDGAIRDALPRLDQAADKDAYLRALKELATRVGDGHVFVYAANSASRVAPPFEVRLVERKPVLVRVLDDAAKAGLTVGDVVETLDGKPIADVIADTRRIYSGSTDEARDQRAADRALDGYDGTSFKLGVRAAGGTTKEVTLAHKRAYSTVLWHGSETGPHWKKLPGNIGYADLRELTVPEVPTMFHDLADTKALVLDMRGYPNGTAWSIAPRINTKHATYGAQFLAPLVRANNRDLDERTRFLQPLPKLPPGEKLYTGTIVVLVDDRAISQAEHTCLFFEQAANTTFVGSPTHGANGDVTVMRLPGGLRMSFTGQEVRHVDGRQLQRVGIQPNILVRPTLAGVRAGKDEVLDRALAFIAAGK